MIARNLPEQNDLLHICAPQHACIGSGAMMTMVSAVHRCLSLQPVCARTDFSAASSRSFCRNPIGSSRRKSARGPVNDAAWSPLILEKWRKSGG